MDRQQAQKLIKETFENPFDKVKFASFIKNLLNQVEDAPFTYQGNYIPDAYKSYISSLERLYKYSDSEHEIDILVVQLKKQTSLERARTMQRNFIAWYLNGSRGGKMKDAALVAFISPGESDWRFSLVKMDYRFEETKDGKVKVKEELTPAKRWSFLVGSNEASHTAQSRLVNILADDEHNPTLKQLEEAFNIETVTKEFFFKYRELFIRTKEALDKVVAQDAKVKADFDAKGIDTVNFAKKLLGQIVFLYFLQKKGWFGVKRDAEWGTGSKHFLRELFEGKHGSYNNFFNDILEPLFYEALRIDRSHDDHYYSRFNCKIPFLNGGLFDPIGNYDWVHTDINIPNELFSNSVKTKEGDIGNGILDIFDRYNFTVKEDEPLEKEVAIDPELLGKAYEKFNAIRPDNFEEYKAALKSGQKDAENKFNKTFGVYYTPREIVHYMCKQSLINYLYTRAEEAGLSNDIKKQDIEDLIEVGEMITEHEATAFIKQEKIKNGIQKSTEYVGLLSNSIWENAETIDNWLADITVCDPAVGSGAFPVGMMHEIVKARNLLSTFIKDPNRTTYTFKRECIEKSLYGVDIDPGAVEIAKLRLWLSLVVDEDDIRQIKPLPNLDYKIVCGNSLLGVEKNLFNNELFAELERLKPLYFNETNPSKKQEYKKRIDELISQITNGHTEFDFEVYFSEVFHKKGGFDVVIGNPPYVKEYTNRKAFDGIRESPYYQGKMDIWYLFACKGIDVLKDNSGILTFIAQNNWVTSYGASKLRNKVIKDTTILQMLDFGDYKIFENAGIQTMIMMFKKDSKTDNYRFDYRRLTSNNEYFQDVLDLLNKKPNPRIENLTPIISRDKYIGNPLTFSHLAIEEILDKPGNRSNFKLYESEIAQGIVCPQDCVISAHKKILGNHFNIGDGIFVLNNNEKDTFPFSKKELELIKPYYTTKELGRYYANKNNSEWIIYTDSRFKYLKNIQPYPNIKKHLDKFQKIITSDNKPYGLHRARDEKFFKGEKIITIRKCTKPAFTYTDFECYVSAAFYVIKTERINLKYLIGLLNSRLIAFWFKHKGKMQGNNYQIDKEPLLALPIIKPSEVEQKKIIDVVNKILSLTQSEDYLEDQQKQAKVKALEREIDQMVYQLYGLTEEEIRIVEGNLK